MTNPQAQTAALLNPAYLGLQAGLAAPAAPSTAGARPLSSEQVNEIATALAKAQAVMPSAVMNRTNPHFKSRYADLASIVEAVKGPLADNGISRVQSTRFGDDGSFVLRTALVHSSGQWFAAEYPLPANGKPQELGSALTYARRYTLSSLTGVVADEDDDANAAQAAAKTVAATIGITEADDLLEEAAAQGTGALQTAWQNLPNELRGRLKASLERRHKPSALTADKERIGVSSALSKASTENAQ